MAHGLSCEKKKFMMCFILVCRSRGIQLGRHWLRRPQLHFSQRDMSDLTSILDRRSTFLLSSTASATLSLTTTLLHAAFYRNVESYG